MATAGRQLRAGHVAGLAHRSVGSVLCTWRVALSTCTILVLTGSHIVVHGFTVIFLLIRLLEHADRLGRSPGDTQTISRPAVGRPRRPVALPAIAVSGGFARVAGSVIADGLATAITRPRRLRPETPVPASQRRSRLLCRNLSGSQVDALIPALPCRRCHRTRRTGGGHGDGDRTGSWRRKIRAG